MTSCELMNTISVKRSNYGTAISVKRVIRQVPGHGHKRSCAGLARERWTVLRLPSLANQSSRCAAMSCDWTLFGETGRDLLDSQLLKDFCGLRPYGRSPTISVASPFPIAAYGRRVHFDNPSLSFFLPVFGDTTIMSIGGKMG